MIGKLATGGVVSEKFDVPKWDPQKILKCWEQYHGKLDSKWRTKFLSHPLVFEITEFHPTIIKYALEKNRRLETAIKHCVILRNAQDDAIENYDKGPWVSAHLTQKPYDPFFNEDSRNQFVCTKCNLKFSKSFKAMNVDPFEICRSCLDQE